MGGKGKSQFLTGRDHRLTSLEATHYLWLHIGQPRAGGQDHHVSICAQCLIRVRRHRHPQLANPCQSPGVLTHLGPVNVHCPHEHKPLALGQVSGYALPDGT